MRGLRTAVAAVAVAGAALGGLGLQMAHASGGGAPTPWYLDARGGGPGDLGRLYAGHVGVVMARASEPGLMMDWRLLHRLKVGAEIGPTLLDPCCTAPEVPYGGETGVYGWLSAHKAVPGAPATPDFLQTDIPGPDYSTLPNCFPEAFDTATATLKDRSSRYGAGSPAVLAWLAAQDAVFDACHHAEIALPALPADAPAWLKADHAYQAGAFALYQGHNGEAAQAFAAIARDGSSPWQSKGLYLQVRALQREALAHPGPQTFAASRAAIARLAAAPKGTFGQSQARGMLRALAYRDQPGQLLPVLEREISQADPPADIAVGFRDYLALSRKADAMPEVADWVTTLGATEAGNAADHARDRWTRTHDTAWLLAALALTSPGDAEAASLATAAGGVPADHPGWLSAQYHQIRLTLAGGDPATMRKRLDAILALPDLSANDRALFTAERLQVAADLADFVRFSVRRPICTSITADVEEGLCGPNSRAAGVYRTDMHPGFGEDARAAIDRMPLAMRMSLSRSAALPADLRLDVALSNFARAVLLQDDAAVGAMAGDLALLLPALKADWLKVAATPPGPDKRFAEAFVMARIPGLAPDLAYQTRPEGKVAEYQGHWLDWLVLARGHTAGPQPFVAESVYQQAEVWYDEPVDEGGKAPGSDLTCLGQCGLGAFPLRLPAFLATAQGAAAAERAYFFSDRSPMDSETYPPTPPTAAPAGAQSVWEDMLTYVRAHPADPRSPEALYWLIHITRWGVTRDHLGHRAFTLLHERYPTTTWAKRSPYYYD